MAIIGIDLGTTNSLAAVWRGGKCELIPNAAGEYLTPSAVSIDDDGTVLVGRAARDRLITAPDRSAARFKRAMGTNKIYTLGGRRFTPEELSALVLRSLREDAEAYLGETVEEAVVSVPAYFAEAQRAATKRAAALAGLKVERLVNEPSAAAVAGHINEGDSDKVCLVFDFGGGTLDVSLVERFENVVSVTAVSGDNRLGGQDFDRVIAKAFCEDCGIDYQALPVQKREMLVRQAENCKMALTHQENVIMSVDDGEGMSASLMLSNEWLIRKSSALFRRMTIPIQHVFLDAGISPHELNDLVMVGGSSHMPVVRRYIARFLHKEPVRDSRPDTSIALGAGICAGMKARAADLRELVLTDVCPFSLGVATYNDLHDKTPHMAFLIQRSSMLPASRQETFYTLQSNQQALRFEIYQGEGYFASENLKLGELEVQVPPGTAGEQSAAVTFTYDIDGILHVSARSSGGDYRDRLILNSRLHLTEEERAQALERISQIRLAAQGTQRERYLLEKALSLYQQSTGRLREAIAHLIRHFQANLEQGDRISRERVYRHVQKQLEQFQHYFQSDPFAEDFWADPEELEDTDEDTEDEE